MQVEESSHAIENKNKPKRRRELNLREQIK